MSKQNKFPIKYIENNLVINNDNECFAYFELMAYHYSFLGLDEKVQIHNDFRQLLGLEPSGKIQLLQLSTESSRRDIAERSKKYVTGDLKDVAYDRIDRQTDLIIDKFGETQVDYRYFVGFKLELSKQETNLTSIKNEIVNGFADFLNDVNNKAMGDYVTIRDGDIKRYMQMEKLLYKRITDLFKVKRATVNDIGYVIEHIYGKSGVPYESYKYDLPYEKTGKDTVIKKYDILKLTRVEMEEGKRHLRLSDGEYETYAAYMPLETIVDGLNFPDNEVLYRHEMDFAFPVDTSINIEVVENRKALSTVRNKKKELKDLDNHAWESNNDTTQNVVDALDLVNDLETELVETKESVYRFSYVVRVLAPTLDELEERCKAISDTYEKYNMKLIRPLGDMMGFHSEFVPSGKRYLNDYLHTESSEMLASLGFGASQVVGERDGIFIGFNANTGRAVYIRPNLAAQGVSGSVTNALAVSFTGSLGGGKSLSANELMYYCVLTGAQTIIVDPKSERGGWKEALPDIAHEINIVNLTSDAENQGLLDPYVIMDDVKDAERLALDVLSFLTGIDTRDGTKFPILRKAVRRVNDREQRGLLYVIDELRDGGGEVGEQIADHVESFTDYDFAQLLFSRGEVKDCVSLDKQLNVIQVADLSLPNNESTLSEYTPIEILSISMLLVISAFACNFIKTDKSKYKIVALDEAWSIMQVGQGKSLASKLIREGRSMNASVYFITQQSDDLIDEKIKNNIGLKFAFRSTDMKEIENILKYLDVDSADEGNQMTLKNLANGECLFRDLYGRVGVVYFDPVFEDLFDAFDTRPPIKEESFNE